MGQEDDLAFEGNGDDDLAAAWFQSGLKYRETQKHTAGREQPMDAAFYDASEILRTWLRMRESDTTVVDAREGTALGHIVTAMHRGLECQAIWFGVHERSKPTLVIAGRKEIHRGRGNEYILVVSLAKDITLEELDTEGVLAGIMHLNELDRQTEFGASYDDRQNGRQRIIDTSGITIPSRTIGPYPASS